MDYNIRSVDFAFAALQAIFQLKIGLEEVRGDSSQEVLHELNRTELKCVWYRSSSDATQRDAAQ